MKKIMVVTSTRADYGLLRPVVKRIYDSARLELCLVATGTHLMEKYGNTVEEIETNEARFQCLKDNGKYRNQQFQLHFDQYLPHLFPSLTFTFITQRQEYPIIIFPQLP